MRFLLAVLPVLLLTGCDNEQIQTCEAHLKDRLKAPSSYKRIAAERTVISPEVHRPPYDEVTLTYDAVNSFNAPLRDTETCFFEAGSLSLFNPYAAEEAALAAKAQADADEIERKAEQALSDAANASANASAAIASANERMVEEEQRRAEQRAKDEATGLIPGRGDVGNSDPGE